MIKNNETMNKRIILWLVLLAMAVGVRAQTGLSVSGVFEGKVVPRSRMVETRVRGRALSKYQLSTYRSLRFLATAAELEKTRKLFDSDAASARSSYVKTKGKHSATTIVSLPPRGSANRFLCLQYRPENKVYRVTIVYMEGEVKDLSTLRELLEN